MKEVSDTLTEASKNTVAAQAQKKIKSSEENGPKLKKTRIFSKTREDLAVFVVAGKGDSGK